MFIEVLCTIAQIWKQRKSSSLGKWINRHPYNGILFNAKKKEMIHQAKERNEGNLNAYH